MNSKEQSNVEPSHVEFSDKKSSSLFGRRFLLITEEQTQFELRMAITKQLSTWNKSLDEKSEFKLPKGFEVSWIGVSDWNELKNQRTCTNCGSSVHYAEPNCSACLTAKPHFVLTIKEETTAQLLNSPITDLSSIPTVLPKGHVFDVVGVTNTEELNKFRNCIYCGAPILFTFPACSHCGMSKPYLKLHKEADATTLPIWKVGENETIIRKVDISSYLEDGEITISAGYAAGVCEATKVNVGEGATIVAANAIEVKLELNSKAHELAARYITIGRNASVHTVVVYNNGTLIIDESSNIDEVFLGSGVKIEVRGLLKHELFQKIREALRAKNQCYRHDVDCDLPRGMIKRLQLGK